MIAKVHLQRMERVLWELEQLSEELFDMGYITEGNQIQSVVYALDQEIQEKAV